MRSKPASMMSRRIMSVTNQLITEGLLDSMLVITQVLATGTHTARICGWIRQGQRIELKNIIHSDDT